MSRLSSWRVLYCIERRPAGTRFGGWVVFPLNNRTDSLTAAFKNLTKDAKEDATGDTMNCTVITVWFRHATTGEKDTKTAGLNLRTVT